MKKLYLLFFIILIAGCEKENLPNQNNEKELDLIDVPVLKEEVSFNSLNQFYKLNSSKNKETITSILENDSLKVSFNGVLKLEYNESVTYTFKLFRDQPKFYVENFLIYYNKKTKVLRGFLVQYHISQKEFLNINKNPFVSNDKVVITPLDNYKNLFKGSFDCQEYSETVYISCSSGEHHSGNIEAWGNCTATTKPYAYQDVKTKCTWISSDTDDPGSTGGGGESAGGDGSEDPIYTSPNPSEPCLDRNGNPIGFPDENGNCETLIPFPDTNSDDDCNTFEEKIKEVLNTEGGFVDDSSDPGGPTNRGISWPVWESYANDILNVEPTIENLKNLTEVQAKSIYKALYWDKIYADDINDGDLRFLLFDFYVNSGGNAIKTLQRTLNDLGLSISADGVLGLHTLTAINNFPDQIGLYNKFKNARKSYYEKITEKSVARYLVKNPMATSTEIKQNTFKKFINGWLNRVNKFIDKTEDNPTNVNC